MAEIGTLPKNDAALALALARGATLRAAAEHARMSLRTAARRWEDPRFRRHVDSLRADMLQRALGQLSHAMTGAARRLRELAAGDDKRVSLAACKAILALGQRLKETADLEARVAELERRALERANGSHLNGAANGHFRA